MGAVVQLQVTGADVIHAWTIPAFGVKIDAVPGRLNETWFQAEEEGVYFGQCSELCGKDHSYMPITVKVVSQEDYDAWLDWAIDEYGGTRPEAARRGPARRRRAAGRRAGGGARGRRARGGRARAEAPAAEAAARRRPPTGEPAAAERRAAEEPAPRRDRRRRRSRRPSRRPRRRPAAARRPAEAEPAN